MEWMARVNWVDIIVIIILLKGCYVGAQRGFLGELLYILGFYFIIVASIHLYEIPSNFFNKYLFIPLNISDLISFLIIAAVFYFVFRFIYGIIQKAVKIEIFPVFNKMGGTLLGLGKGFILSILIIFILLLVPIKYITDSVKTRSLSGPFLIKTGSELYKKSLSLVSSGEGRDISRLLSGAKPLDFKLFRFRRKDRLDEMLQ